MACLCLNFMAVTTEKTKCKRRMIELKQDRARTERLINIARPNSLDKLRRNPKPPPPVKEPVKIETTKPQAISEKIHITRYHKYIMFPRSMS